MIEHVPNQTYILSSSLLKPNLKLSFGSNTNFHIQYYSEKTPNTFQRWMLKTLLDIVLEDIK